MKRIKMNKWMLMAIGLLVTVGLFILGKGAEAGEFTVATGAVVSLTQEEKDGFNEQEQKVLLAVKKMTEKMKEGVTKGLITKEEIAGLIAGIKFDQGDEAKSLKEQLENLKEMAKKHGTSLTELGLKMNGVETGNKSIAQVLHEEKDEMRKIYNQGSGVKQYMILVNEKGQYVARPYDPTKAAGPHASIADVPTGSGNAASIASSISASTILRMGGDAPIQSQYRNTPWIFDLCNLVNVGMDTPFAIWYDEQAKVGASTTVAEGGTKPKTQYSYTLQSSQYKKEATLLGFSQEFSMDFERLQSDILGKGRIDVVNRINTAVLANIISAATAYNTDSSFGTRAAGAVNDWLVIAAMAAQVDSATFGANANAAIMSTFKKYNLGTQQNADFDWIDSPSVLANMAKIGNPAMGADDVLVGDFKQYNILLRGGLILKVGYNGTDFADNMFSNVLEQFYFDYISTLRTPAIVKGTTFAAVKALLTSG